MKHLLVIFGPAGCGKSTVGRYVAKENKYNFIEGDEYHSDEIREKMSKGIRLTDEDREGWLLNLSQTAVSNLSTDPAPNLVVIVACSALKAKYRDVFRDAVKLTEIKVHFVFLKLTQEKAVEIVERRQKTAGHFMSSALVPSQFEDLEVPGIDERDCVVVDHPEFKVAMAKAKIAIECLVGEFKPAKEMLPSNRRGGMLDWEGTRLAV